MQPRPDSRKDYKLFLILFDFPMCAIFSCAQFFDCDWMRCQKQNGPRENGDRLAWRSFRHVPFVSELIGEIYLPFHLNSDLNLTRQIALTRHSSFNRAKVCVLEAFLIIQLPQRMVECVESLQAKLKFDSLKDLKVL